jgi:HTH-type transcriptional regulator / antitoxin HigA
MERREVNMTNAPTILERWEAFNAVAAPYLEPITSEAEYDNVDALLNDISDRMDHPNDPRYIGLFRLLSARLHEWEANQEPLPDSAPHELLEYLIQEHDLKQTDLKDLVDQSTLSKILRGERSISKRLALGLAAHFHVPVTVFLEG